MATAHLIKDSVLGNEDIYRSMIQVTIVARWIRPDWEGGIWRRPVKLKNPWPDKVTGPIGSFLGYSIV